MLDIQEQVTFVEALMTTLIGEDGCEYFLTILDIGENKRSQFNSTLK
jgi:hypothetical protein